jgi:serine/threonine-protein kinase
VGRFYERAGVSNNDTPREPNETVDPLVGLTLSGRFVLERLISRGGMGKVYLANQKPLNRVVALKVLDVVDDTDGQFRRRFFMEASLCAKLTHPHTVRIYDYGATDDGIFFIAMEYIEGLTLHDMLYRESPLDPLRAVVILRRVCGALAEAHDAGIVHRDLKPANILLSKHGDDRDFPTVIDFGLVKELGKESELSRTGHVLGSPLYMAPEQVEGRPVDGRADVYAIGLILYYALCGKTAFKRANPMAVLMAQVHKSPAPFSEVNPGAQISPLLEWVVRRCIEKRMEERFGSMHELLRALKVCEMVLRSELNGPIELSLEDGRLVLPEGIDISEEHRMPPSSSVPRGSSVPPAVSNRVVNGAVDTTLLPGGSVHPLDQTSASQVTWLVAGGAASAGLIGAIVAVLAFVAIGGWVWADGVGAAQVVASGEPADNLVSRLDSEPSGAEVERNGALVGVTPLELTVVPGEAYTVTVKSPKHLARTVRIDGSQGELMVRLGAELPSGSPGPTVAPVVKPAGDPTPTPKPRPMGDIRDPWEDG